MFTGPVGPVEVFFSAFFYWPEAVLGNFYWPGAMGSPLASSPEYPVRCQPPMFVLAFSSSTGLVRATLTVVSAVVYYMMSISRITVRDPSI